MSRIIPVQSSLALIKPGLGIGIVISALPGFLTGFTVPSGGFIINILVGLFLVASASFVYNQIYEQKIDRLMKRTQSRPLVIGKISILQAHFIASTCLGIGLVILFTNGGWLTSGIALASLLYYIFVYTIWLKPRTHWNTFWGGIAGSVGPLVSDSSVNGTITELGFMMFIFLFLWQPPHFWLLGLHYLKDYQAIKIPILPVIVSKKRCIGQIIFYYTILLIVMALSFNLGLTSLIFLIPSLLSGTIVIAAAYSLLHNKKIKILQVFFLALLHMMIWHVSLALDLWFTRFS